MHTYMHTHTWVKLSFTWHTYTTYLQWFNFYNATRNENGCNCVASHKLFLVSVLSSSNNKNKSCRLYRANLSKIQRDVFSGFDPIDGMPWPSCAHTTRFVSFNFQLNYDNHHRSTPHTGQPKRKRKKQSFRNRERESRALSRIGYVFSTKKKKEKNSNSSQKVAYARLAPH